MLADHLSLLPPPACLDQYHDAIDRYFTTLNLGQFQATAALFSPQGVLHPAVEDPVVGQDAIATYLQQECAEMQLQPGQRLTFVLESGKTLVRVYGVIKLCPFGTSVAWTFLLNSDVEIEQVQVELLS
ncbi:MAG TPA: nuclear transport factor 2 family protein [Allocoleopsis sp.]